MTEISGPSYPTHILDSEDGRQAVDLIALPHASNYYLRRRWETPNATKG